MKLPIIRRGIWDSWYSAHATEQFAERDGFGVSRSAVRRTLKHGKSLGPRRDVQGRWSLVYQLIFNEYRALIRMRLPLEADVLPEFIGLMLCPGKLYNIVPVPEFCG